MSTTLMMIRVSLDSLHRRASHLHREQRCVLFCLSAAFLMRLKANDLMLAFSTLLWLQNKNNIKLNQFSKYLTTVLSKLFAWHTLKHKSQKVTLIQSQMSKWKIDRNAFERIKRIQLKINYIQWKFWVKTKYSRSRL
jgi:hypothetical protein